MRWCGGRGPVKAPRRDGPSMVKRRATSSTRPAKRNQHTIAAWSRGVCGRRLPALPGKPIGQAAPDQFLGIENATPACRWIVKWRSPVQGQRITTKPRTAHANHVGCARLRTVEGAKRARGPWKGGCRRRRGTSTNCRITDTLCYTHAGGPARGRRPGRAFCRRRIPKTLKRGAKIERR